MDITNEEVHKKGVQRVSKYSRKKIIWISSTVIIGWFKENTLKIHTSIC